MKKETRTVCFDPELNIEVYRFEGVMQRFPQHFHDYYVIGFIESGQRYLQCGGRDYTVGTGDLLLFNPDDVHTCEQVGAGTLDYRCINISPETMKKAVLEITGEAYLPCFSPAVVYRSDLVWSLKELHQIILQESADFKREELFYFLIEQLLEENTEAVHSSLVEEASSAVKVICGYLEENYSGNIALDDLSALTGLSKYYLLRSFTKQKGISPYGYLETIRIGKAKKLLEQGVLPLDTALQTGFSDQSHFTNFFKRLIGLTPRQYMNIFVEKNEGLRRDSNNES